MPSFSPALECSDCILFHDPIGNWFRPAVRQIDHRVVEEAITTKLRVGTPQDFESYLHAGALHSINPCSHHKLFTQPERPFIIQMGRFDVPTVTGLDEFLHRHFVTALHLVVAGGEYI